MSTHDTTIDRAAAPPAAEGGCHGGRETMLEAARAAGKSETLDRADAGRLSARPARPAAIDVPGLRLAARRPAHAAHRDHPVGLGLLRVRPDLHLAFLRRAAHRGLRAVQLGDAGHGQLFEDIRERRLRRWRSRTDYDAVVVINLCVPTASGVPLDLLPKQIDGVRIIGIDVPGFGVPTHAEAKDVLAGAMLRYARLEAEAGPVARPRSLVLGDADGDADRRVVPGRSGRRRRAAGADGPGRRAATARRANGATCMRALDCVAVAAVHPFYTASVREFHAAGRPVVGSGPVGVDGTAAWLEAIGRRRQRARRQARCRQGARPAGDPRGAGGQPDHAPASPCRATRARNCWSPAC